LIQKIDDRLYKINTIFPGNIVDTESNTIELGSIDYNGRECGAGISGATHTLAYVIHSRYANSIDPGEKLIGYTYVTNTAMPYGYMNPVNYAAIYNSGQMTKDEVDTYLDDTYNVSYQLVLTPAGAYSYDSSKVNLLYIPETSLPVALGSTYNNYAAQTLDKTIFLLRQYTDPSGDKHTFDAYLVGNDTFGFYSVFVLFGQIYL
jgi:hypothetical protein